MATKISVDLDKYKIRIVPTTDRGPAYRLTGIRKLSGAENGGSSNIFVHIWDENGRRLTWSDLRIRSVIVGQAINYFKPDKPSTPIERGHGDVPMSARSVYAISMVDTRSHSSDVVHGLRSDWPDEEPGNTWGHHSFALEFQLLVGEMAPSGEPLPVDAQGVALRAWLAEGENLPVQIDAWLAKGRALVG